MKLKPTPNELRHAHCVAERAARTKEAKSTQAYRAYVERVAARTTT